MKFRFKSPRLGLHLDLGNEHSRDAKKPPVSRRLLRYSVPEELA
jgi:hypothetical protein